MRIVTREGEPRLYLDDTPEVMLTCRESERRNGGSHRLSRRLVEIMTDVVDGCPPNAVAHFVGYEACQVIDVVEQCTQGDELWPRDQAAMMLQDLRKSVPAADVASQVREPSGSPLLVFWQQTIYNR